MIEQDDTQGLFHQQQLEHQEWLEIIAQNAKLKETFNDLFGVKNEHLPKT